MRHLTGILPIVAAFSVAGCQREPDAAASVAPDPIVAAALGEELMTDPDLARQNRTNAAIAGGGPASAPIPPERRSAEAIAAARAEAARMAGGSLRRAPLPEPGAVAAAGETLALTANRALATGGERASCAGKLEYAFAWAARFPAAIPIYPRGHVQEAAGTDRDGCRLRIANFVTPVPVADLVDFYWSLAARAGLSLQHRMAGSDHVVAGSKGGAAFVVHVRERGGMTEADLVTNGL